MHGDKQTRELEAVPLSDGTSPGFHRHGPGASELKSVLETVITIVNYIKSRPLNSRLFASLCHKLGSEHQAVPHVSQVAFTGRCSQPPVWTRDE
ncbi:hypothetical protein NHX12_006887, partial [Muraenolepis orangiensis]